MTTIGRIDFEFQCDEHAATSWCRKVCAQDCEEWTEAHEEETGHPWAYRSSCNVEEWLDNTEPYDTYDGPDGAPVVSGPIEVRWESGVGYVWRLPAGREDPREEVRLLRESLRAVVIELESL